jgi:hypothetical protein
VILIALGNARHCVLPDHHADIALSEKGISHRSGSGWSPVQQSSLGVDILEAQSTRPMSVY